MTIAKSKVVRPYAPDFVDAATLAYRLCVSQSTVTTWEREGKLPLRRNLFGILRWKWSEVEASFDVRETVETDAFMERLSD